MPRVDPERALALSYAPRARRAGLEALFALDEALGSILRTTREPLVGQMRLTWWHAALMELDIAPPPTQPVLQALAAEVLPRGVSGAQLAGMIDGWEALLEEPLNEAAMLLHARARGGGLFVAAGTVITSVGDPLATAGEGWALADLARNLGDGKIAARAVQLARPRLAEATRCRWSRAARPLGALAQLAQLDLDVPRGSPVPRSRPARVARLAWHRLTGR
jgi:phytoene synthase